MSTPGLTASGSNTPFTPLLFNPNNDQAAQAAARARALAAAQAAAAAAEAAARAAREAAAAAARKAAASRQAAQEAAAAAAKKGATQADKDAAAKAKQQAATDDADAQKKASASDLAQKKATLEDSKRDDLKAGRDPATNPSAATVKAQADFDAAGQEDAIVNPPAGADDPLAAAQADAAAKFKAFSAATNSGDRAKADAARAAWLDAVQHQMQVAALEAGAKGQDQKAAVQSQLDGVLKAIDKDGTFDRASVGKALQPLTDQLGTAPPDQIRAGMEYQSESAAGQAQIADLQGRIKDLQAKADAADAAAAAPKVYGPYVPGREPTPSLLTTSAGSGRPLLLTPAQQKAAAAHDALDAAKDKLANLEAVYGHTDPKNERNDTIGTLQADYNARCATTAVAQAKAAYLKLAGDPSTNAKDLSAAYDAWQGAVDQQTLALKLQDATNAGAALLRATQDRTAAQAALASQPASPFLTTTTSSFGQTDLLVSDNAPAGAQTPQQRLASANAAFTEATKKSQDAQAALDQVWTDQKGGSDGRGLDVSGTVDAAADVRGALTTAQTDLSAAQSEFDAAQFGRPGAPTLADARTRLGLAQQAVDLAQAKVKRLDAMQALRQAQLSTDGGAQPADLDTLTANVRAAQKTVDDLQGTRLVSVDDRKALVTTTLPGESKTLAGLDQQIETARDKGDTGSPALKSLLDQRDWLNDKITLQKNAVALQDAQDAASAAPYEYGRSTRLTGVDLTRTGHSDEADAALTWGITPGGPDGHPRISGLPSNIQASDVKVEKEGDTWYAVFGKDSGAYAARWTGGRFPVRSYVDGSKQGDIAIEKGHKYKLDPATARLWEATNTDPGVGRSALVVAKDNYDKALAKFKLDPQTDAAGKPVLGPDHQLSTATTTNVAGETVAAIDFNTDQSAAKTSADTDVARLSTTLADAKSAAAAAPGDATLKAAQAKAQSDYELAVSHQGAIGAVLDWQQARLTRQIDDADTRDGRPAMMCYATPPQQAEDKLYKVAVSKVADWRSTQQKVAVGGAQQDLDAAQAAFDQWHGAHSYLSTESVDASSQYQALQAAHGKLDLARRELTLAATTDSDARQKAYIAQNLAPGKESDPHELYKLFNKDPQVMAQSIIDQDYIRNGGVPQTYAGRDAIGRMVSGELYTNADATKTIVDQIVKVGGDNAKVTIIPVVYAMDADADKGGGIVKTALFKVQDGSDPKSFKFVDAYGERYDSVDDYRGNNNLPVDGVNLAMPKDGDFTLDANGNVELFTGKARTETGWEHFTRVTHFDTVVGVVGLAAGIVLEVGSAGILTEIAAPLAIASTAYLAGTSAQDLANRSQHGLSIDPFTNREAGMDWLNLGASALALPGLGSAARVSSETATLTRAGVDADSIAVVTSKGRALLRNGTDVTDQAQDYHLLAGSSGLTNATRVTAGVLGGAGMADQTLYVAQNWSTMTSAEREQQGSGLLLNLGMMVGGHAAGRIAGARGARGADPVPADTAETTRATDATATPGHDGAPGLGTDTTGTRSVRTGTGHDRGEADDAPHVTLVDDRTGGTQATASTGGAAPLEPVDFSRGAPATSNAATPAVVRADDGVATTSAAAPPVDAAPAPVDLAATDTLLSDPAGATAAGGVDNGPTGRSPAAVARQRARRERLEARSRRLLDRVVAARDERAAKAAGGANGVRGAQAGPGATARGASADAAIDAARVGHEVPQPETDLVDPGWYLQTMKRAAMHPAVRAKITERLAEYNHVTPEEMAPRVEAMFGDGAQVDAALGLPQTQRSFLGMVRDALGELEHEGQRVELDGYAPANAPWADTYAIRPSRPPQPRTATDLATALENTTRHAGRIATAIRNGDMKVELLDHDTYVSTHAKLGGQGDSPLAFTQGHTIYLDLGRGEGGNQGWALLLDAVHEGTHALDNLSGYDVGRDYRIQFKGQTLDAGQHAPGPFPAGDQEARAYFYQLEFARAMGLGTETFGEAEFPALLPEGTFGAGDGMEAIHAHIQLRYPNAQADRWRRSADSLSTPPIDYQRAGSTGAKPTDDTASGVDDAGWTLDSARYGSRVADGTLMDVLQAGGRLDDADFVVYPVRYSDETGLATNALTDGLQGIAREGDAAVDTSTTPVAYDTLDAALAARRPGDGSFERHDVAIVARNGHGPGGDAAPAQVLARLRFRHDDPSALAGVDRNAASAGELRIAWPAGWKPGDPLISGQGDGAVDLLNAPAADAPLAVNVFRRRAADLRLFSDEHRGVNERTGQKVDEEFPVPEGYYAVETHGADTGRWVMGPDGRAMDAAEVAALVRQDPRWQGRPVFLNVCQAGEGRVQFAQELASELGVDVYGADGQVKLGGRALADAPDTAISSLSLARTPTNLHQPAPTFRRYQPGLKIVGITEGGREVFGPGKGLGVRPEFDAAGIEPGSTTRSIATTPAPEFRAAKMRLPEHAAVDIDTMDWTTRATQADAEAAGSAPPLAQADPAAAAIADALRADPAAGSRDFFVVSRRGPGRAIADGRGVDTSKAYATFDDAVAALAQNRKLRGGAWVHRVSGANFDPAALGKGAHLAADDVAGSIFVDGQQQPTALVVANPAADAWADLAPPASAARMRGGALVQPGVRTLADADAVVAHADQLVAQYRPGAGRTAPPAADALVTALRQSRLTGARTRFVVSDKPPAEVFGDATARLDRAPSFKSFKGAAEDAQSKGGRWVYRAELPQVRSKGQPIRWDVVGGLHVYDDGAVMPVGVARTDAAAWTRPGALRVATTATAGVLAFAGVSYLARGLPFNLPHDTLTLAAIGTMVRSAAKISRFGHAGRWQSRFVEMQETAANRADFESALRQLDALDGSPGTTRLSQAVADFRRTDRALSGTKADARAGAIRGALEPLRQAAGTPGDALVDTLVRHVDAKARFDVALDRHAAFLDHLTAPGGKAGVRRFVAGMHDKVDDQGVAKGPISSFRQQFGDVQNVLVGWERGGPSALSDDALKANLEEAVGKLHVAPELRKGASPIRWALDGVQFTTYAVAWGSSLHGVDGEALSQTATWAFNAAFAADAVRITGVRFAGLLDRKLSDGATKTASSQLYSKWLPAADDSFTTAAGIVTLGNGVQDLLGLHRGAHGLVARPDFGWVHDLRVAVTGGYAGINGLNWRASMRRNFGDPAVDDQAGRRANFWLKIGTGVAAAVLAGDSIMQKALASNSPQNANNQNGSNQNQNGQPTPGVSPSTTPGLPTPGITATAGPSTPGTPSVGPSTGPGQGTPSTPGTPGTPGTGRPPGTPRPTRAQVIVMAGDPRRDTLWGIAASNERSLLTTAQREDVRAHGGGDDAQALAALKQLFQLNPQRGFRPELMDGVASAVQGDPDTLQPGWRIDVDNPAVS